MAQQTALNANFQARDWEFLIGLVGLSPDPDVLDVIAKLHAYYEAQGTKPQGSTVVSIATFEGLVMTLFKTLLMSNTGITQTDNAQPYTRIKQALLAMNNAADNYIQQSVTALEANYAANQIAYKKQGRKIIMMRDYDNN